MKIAKHAKLGILGGTFNPVHVGHLILAQESAEKLGLDKVVFVPSNIPPHKSETSVIKAEDRYNMLLFAIQGNPLFEVSRLEIERPGRSYSVESMKEFRIVYGKEAGLFFITGSDSLKEISTWKDLKGIFKLVKFVVAEREGYPLEGVPEEAQVIRITPIGISSSLIRERIGKSRSIRYLVPDGVLGYIEEKRLYRTC